MTVIAKRVAIQRIQRLKVENSAVCWLCLSVQILPEYLKFYPLNLKNCSRTQRPVAFSRKACFRDNIYSAARVLATLTALMAP